MKKTGGSDGDVRIASNRTRTDGIQSIGQLISRDGFGVDRTYIDENDLTRRISAVCTGIESVYHAFQGRRPL